MRRDELRLRLEELYRQYDHRFVTPDPLEFVRAQATDADREVVGLLAAGLAFGTVAQIKRSIAAVLDALGPRPAEAVAGQPGWRVLRSFKRLLSDAELSLDSPVRVGDRDVPIIELVTAFLRTLRADILACSNLPSAPAA